MRVRCAALAGDGVDALDVLGAHVVQDLVDQADALVLAHARAEELVELVVGGVDHGRGLGEQADLVVGLDAAGGEEQLLAVDDGDTGLLQGEQDRQLDDVDADGLPQHPVGLQLDPDLAGDLLRDPGPGVERPAQRRDPGPRAGRGPGRGAGRRGRGARPVVGAVHRGGVVDRGGGPVQPGAVQLVVLGRGPEVPDAPARRRGPGARTGSSCPPPTCRCGWRSCSGCW